MKNVRNENIMEHSHMVAAVAHALAVISNVYFKGELNPEHAATLALFHDSSEALTGDLPTPIKYFNPEINSAFRGIEKIAEEKLLSMLPLDMQKIYSDLMSPVCPEFEIVKCADKICAYIKCVEELSVSNREFKRAEKTIIQDIRAMKRPEVDFFVEYFLPAFSLSLDELE